jgi:SAM-dependent methyltransferase
MTPAGTPQVAAHYARWPFPGTEHRSREGLVLLRSLAGWLRGAERARVADMGCGTGHTLVAIARRFPAVEFVGVDVVAAALERARAHAAAVGAANVAFITGDVAGVLPDVGVFDAVLCLGVLHHVAEPTRALANLVSLTAPGGRVVLWLYGRHGRAPHQLNQAFVRALAGDDPDAVPAVARAFVATLGERFASGTGFYAPPGDGPEGLRWLLEHEEWLADQMFPALERPVTMPEILDLFEAHGLRFEKSLAPWPEFASLTPDPLLRERFTRLSVRDQWAALDLLLRPPYYFVVGRRGMAAGGPGP